MKAFMVCHEKIGPGIRVWGAISFDRKTPLVVLCDMVASRCCVDGTLCSVLRLFGSWVFGLPFYEKKCLEASCNFLLISFELVEHFLASWIARSLSSRVFLRFGKQALQLVQTSGRSKSRVWKSAAGNRNGGYLPTLRANNKTDNRLHKG